MIIHCIHAKNNTMTSCGIPTHKVFRDGDDFVTYTKFKLLLKNKKGKKFCNQCLAYQFKKLKIM